MEPSVVAVMLTCDREELTKRAVGSFESQTYGNKTLAILDTSKELIRYKGHFQQWVIEEQKHSVGYLRNMANALLDGKIIVHWDSDDWSHPNRITEQVALLQSSGADVVGYSDMLFWREFEPCEHCAGGDCCDPQAWLYTATKGCAPALGTSLCYWRKTWEKNPFPDQPKPGNMGSEYGNWLKALKCAAVTSLHTRNSVGNEPRMIARIHVGNSQRDAYQLEKLVAGGSREWQRMPQWDERLRGILA